MIEIKNRLPTKPNRWKITHESSGAEEYITWEYADEPTESGTPINKGLYSRIYNTDIAPLGGISLHSTIADREGFLLCDGSLITTIDYPDMSAFANALLAINTGGTFDYEYAGCDYSGNVEKLYFYKITNTLIEIFETTNLETFTKVIDYTLQTVNSPKVEYKNGAIIIKNGGNFAITINRTNFAEFTISGDISVCYYDYYNKKLVIGYGKSSSSTTSNYRIYTISDDSTSVTYTSLGSTYTAHVTTVAYDKANGVWLIGGHSTSSTYYGVIYLSSDNTATFSQQLANEQYNLYLAYNEYTEKVYALNAQKIYEIENVNDVFNSMSLMYDATDFLSINNGYILEAKYPSAFQRQSSGSIIMTNFEKAYYLTNIQPASMFSMGDFSYIRTTNNELYKINVTSKQGFVLPHLVNTANGYYGYIKVEVL